MSAETSAHDTETSTREPTVRFGVSVREFGRIVGVLGATGLGAGLAGNLIGQAQMGQVSAWMLGLLMLGLIPYGGIVVVGILGVSVGERLDDARTAAMTAGAAGLVGHLLFVMLAVPFVMLQPIQPPIGNFVMMELWLRATLATTLVGVLVGIIGNRL